MYVQNHELGRNNTVYTHFRTGVIVLCLRNWEVGQLQVLLYVFIIFIEKTVSICICTCTLIEDSFHFNLSEKIKLIRQRNEIRVNTGIGPIHWLAVMKIDRLADWMEMLRRKFESSGFLCLLPRFCSFRLACVQIFLSPFTRVE